MSFTLADGLATSCADLACVTGCRRVVCPHQSIMILQSLLSLSTHAAHECLSTTPSGNVLPSVPSVAPIQQMQEESAKTIQNTHGHSPYASVDMVFNKGERGQNDSGPHVIHSSFPRLAERLLCSLATSVVVRQTEASLPLLRIRVQTRSAIR